VDYELDVLSAIVSAQQVLRQRLAATYSDQDWQLFAESVFDDASGMFPEWESIQQSHIVAFDTGFWFGRATLDMAEGGTSPTQIADELWKQFEEDNEGRVEDGARRQPSTDSLDLWWRWAERRFGDRWLLRLGSSREPHDLYFAEAVKQSRRIRATGWSPANALRNLCALVDSRRESVAETNDRL
jgi:hypothetical protein